MSIFSSAAGHIGELFDDFINGVSFNSEIEGIVDKINQALEESETTLDVTCNSHPGGFRREFGRRRISIAEAYIVIAKSQAPELYQNRIRALRTMVEQSLHAKTVNMPINTARVQIFMMKEAVKAYGNRRKQMEYVADFGRASFGNEALIRNFLRKNGLNEIPEDQKPLKQLNLGWDNHVHDSLSDGRKSPTHVLIDAFIRGISRVTIVYNRIKEERTIIEAITAGEILGIAVEIGVEFSVGVGGSRRHYMYVPPVFSKSKDFFAFLEENKDHLSAFIDGLEKNSMHRYQAILSVINQFNEQHLPHLNEGFDSDSACYFPPITEADLKRVVASGQPSREHLSELLLERFRRIYLNRVIYLKAQVTAAEVRFKNGSFSQWEFDSLRERYKECRSEYENLSRSERAAKYLATRGSVDYDSSFDSELPILNQLKELPGRIVLIQPLEHGLKTAMMNVIEFLPYIDAVENMNMYDCAQRNPADVIVFNKFIFYLNNAEPEKIAEFLKQYEITDVSDERIKKLRKITAEIPLLPLCGSDSTGRNKAIPGMGFIRESRISPAVKEAFIKKHVALPKPISGLILSKGVWKDDQKNMGDDELIYCLGTVIPPVLNKVGDEKSVREISLSETWHYLNPRFKNVFRFFGGFAVAMYWMWIQQFHNSSQAFFLGLFYASLWFFITFNRNIIVDLVASSGTDFKSWSINNINFDNAFQSLFWTGLSVPVMGIVQIYFDRFWPGAASGSTYDICKFFALCLANGTYIASHNKLRDFDKGVIKANFFRSIIAWPFAAVFAFLGDKMGIPSIVQAKFWSDVVAGFVEGAGKFNQRFILRKRDLIEILPKLSSMERSERIVAMIDILYIWAKAPRGKTCLRLLLLNKPSMGERIWKPKKDAKKMMLSERRARNQYNKLLELFKYEGMVNILSDHVLKNFHGKAALELTNLIGTESENFLQWLKALEKQFKQLKPAVPEKADAQAAAKKSDQPDGQGKADSGKKH